MILKYLFLILLIAAQACTSNTASQLFDEPILTAVDSTNDRLFIFEQNAVILAMSASVRSSFGSQPIVNDERQIAIHDILPTSPIDVAVTAVGDVSRIFLAGPHPDANGDIVSGEILVLDFDGATFTEASFSPLILDDGDVATDETHNLPGGLLVDQNDDRLYVTDATEGRLYIFNTADGSEDAASVDLDGIPNRMAFVDSHLYIANNATLAADQVISVVDTDSFVVTEIDLDIATDDVAVESNDNGTVILAKNAVSQQVLVYEVDTATYAASTAVDNETFTNDDGSIVSGHGISSSIGGVLLTKLANGSLFGYVPQADGNVGLITLSLDLTSFTFVNLPTATDVLEGITAYVDSAGNGLTIYMVASASGDLVYTTVGTTSVDARF